MIVAITLRTATSEHGEVRDALAHDWHPRLADLGADLLLISNRLPDPVAYAKRFGVTHLLLTGGDNLGPSLDTPGGVPETHRDRTEFALLDWATAMRIPTFGVCRGLQTINAHQGGGVCRSVSAASGEDHVATVHDVHLADGSTVPVNSYHDQGVMLDQVAPTLDVFARTEGGVVEGLRHRSLPLAAIQWHPERSTPDTALDDRLIAGWLAGRPGTEDGDRRA